MPSERFVEALNDQIGREFNAAHQYTAVAAYYDRLTFPRLAKFFFDQAEEELKDQRPQPGGPGNFDAAAMQAFEQKVEAAGLKALSSILSEDQIKRLKEIRLQQRLAVLKVELDQCWDLLRQRRALREFGKDPEKAKVRAANVVENYEQ